MVYGERRKAWPVYVHWLAVARLPEYLWRHIARRTAGRCQHVEGFLVHDSRQTKIGDKEVGVVFRGPEQKVLRFQISMHDAMIVEIRNSGECRPDELGRVRFVVAALSAYPVEQLAA